MMEKYDENNDEENNGFLSLLEGDEPFWRIGRGTRVPLQGAVDVVPLLGAIVVCNFGGVGVVPLQSAIVVCYGWGGG